MEIFWKGTASAQFRANIWERDMSEHMRHMSERWVRDERDEKDGRNEREVLGFNKNYIAIISQKGSVKYFWFCVALLNILAIAELHRLLITLFCYVNHYKTWFNEGFTLRWLAWLIQN